MTKLIELIVPVAHAQGNDGVTTNSFTLDKFVFLKPFDSTDPGFFSTVLSRLIGVALTLAAIVAFIYLLFAGFQYITAGGDAAKATGARTGIVNALIGIVVILIAYVILRYVGESLLGTGTAGNGTGF